MTWACMVSRCQLHSSLHPLRPITCQLSQLATPPQACSRLQPRRHITLLLAQLPAWPFVCTSVFMGAYALIPYMALWSPKSPPEQLPPPKEELVGSRRPSHTHLACRLSVCSRPPAA